MQNTQAQVRLVIAQADEYITTVVSDARADIKSAKSYTDIIMALEDVVNRLYEYTTKSIAENILDYLAELHVEAVDLGQNMKYSSGQSTMEQLKDFLFRMDFIYTRVFYNTFKTIDFGVPKTLPRLMKISNR